MVEIGRTGIVTKRRAGHHLARRLHLAPLDEEPRMREKLVAAAVIEVKVRVHHVPDVVGPEAEQSELAHHLVTCRRSDAKETRAPLSQAPDWIGDRLAMDTGIHDHVTLWVVDQE